MSKSGAKFGTGKVGGTVWAGSGEVEHVELQHQTACESLLVGSIFDQCSLALTAFDNDKYGTILQFPVQKPLLAFFLLLLFPFGLLWNQSSRNSRRPATADTVARSQFREFAR